MKFCNGCKKFKDVSEFYVRKKGNRIGKTYEKCIKCMRTRGIQYYHNNRSRQLKLAIERRHRYYKIKRKFIDSLKTRPCKDCGISYPSYVMDFDHLEGSKKESDVASLVTRNLSLEKIKKEIEKCDILCANCHRIRTYKRKAVVAKVVTAEV